MSAASLSPSPPSVSSTQAHGFELLCACASANPAPEQKARIANWNYEGFDWDSFLRLAGHHGVLALVALSLTQHGRALPREVAQSLSRAYETNLKRSLWFAAELARIVAHLEWHEVRSIPYKGPVLAQSAYGDLALRSFHDLDLLIAPADFERAKAALEEIGYRPAQELSPAVERLFLRTGYERSFDSVAGKNLLELQWNLLPYFYAVDFAAADLRVEDLLARARQIELGAAEVPCLSVEDSLLALCLHAAKHLWTRLIWIADIAETLCSTKIDYALVVRRARALGIARIVGVSLRLAERLLGANLPEAARELIARDPEVAELGEFYAARLARAAAYDFESGDYFRQVWNLRERARDRWRYLWRLAWTPAPGEVAAVELPEILFPLYRVVRVGRLLRKLV